MKRLSSVLNLQSSILSPQSSVLRNAQKQCFCSQKLDLLHFSRKCRENFNIRSLRIKFRNKSGFEDSPQLVPACLKLILTDIVYALQSRVWRRRKMNIFRHCCSVETNYPTWMRPAINPWNITPFKIHKFGIKRGDGYTHTQENAYFVLVKHNFAQYIEDFEQNYITPFHSNPLNHLNFLINFNVMGYVTLGGC